MINDAMRKDNTSNPSDESSLGRRLIMPARHIIIKSDIYRENVHPTVLFWQIDYGMFCLQRLTMVYVIGV